MNGKMSGSLLVMMMIVISLWITLTLFVPVEAQGVLNFNVATANETDYARLLAEIRAEVAQPGLHYGNTDLPVMRAPTTPPHYVYVNMEFAGSRTIKFAFSRNDLYLIGYLDMVDGHYRSQFINDAYKNAETSLFPEVTLAKYSKRLYYEGSYAEIAAASEGTKLVQLGIEPLRNQLNKVYGAQQNEKTTKDQAKLLLIVIHMLSEAARSRYIEERVIEKFDAYYDEYVIDPKAESLELKWSRISMAINLSKNGVMPKVQLKNVLGKDWTVTQVRDIVGDMGLLLNARNGNNIQLSQYPKMFMRSSSFVGRDDDGGDNEAKFI